ncbi:hypothetical protein N9K77_00980 [bacterium]|nr:hypothetical protein [bacterium]
MNFKLYDGGKVRRGIKALELQNEVDQVLSQNIHKGYGIKFETQS